MEYGFGMPVRGAIAGAETVRVLAEEGEKLGYGYVSVADHIVMPRSYASTYPYSESGRIAGVETGYFMEQLTLLAHLAGLTETMRLLTSVMVVPHRQPVVAAKTLATIDVLSGGRLTLGVGAGWLAEEFVAVGAPPFAERGRVTDEYLQIFKTLWTQEAPAFQGRYHSFADIHFEPKPVQKPHPPIWVGGESPAALRRAARYGDAWYPIGANPRFPLNTLERYRAGVARLQEALRKEGRSPDALKLAFWANWYKEDTPRTTDTGERHIMTGSDREIADDIKALGDAGVSAVFFAPQRDTVDATLASMRRFRENVAAKVG